MTQHERQRITTERLIRQRAERFERYEANEGFSIALDTYGAQAMMAVFAGEELITQYPAAWDYE